MSGTIDWSLNADASKALSEQEKVIKKLRQANRELGRMARSSRQTQSAGQKMGKSLLVSAGQAVAAYASLTTAINLARAAFRAHEAEKARAAGQTGAALPALGKLAQVATTRKDFEQLKKDARRFAAETGRSYAEGLQMRFTVRSLGLDDQLKTITQLSEIEQESTDKTVEALGTLQNAFGRAGAGNFRQVVNQAAVAATVSKTSLAGVGEAAPISAKAARDIGTKMPEFLATLSVLSKSAQSAEVGSTQIRALSFSLAQKGLGGAGLLAGVEAIKKQGLSEGELFKFLGRKEAVAGFKAISENLGEIRQVAAQTRTARGGTGGAGDFLAGRLSLLRSDDKYVAERNRRLAASEANLAEMKKFSTRESLQQAALETVRKRSVESGENFFTRFVRTAQARVFKALDADPLSIIRAADISGTPGSAFVTQATADFARRLRQSTSTPVPPAGPTGMPAAAESPARVLPAGQAAAAFGRFRQQQGRQSLDQEFALDELRRLESVAKANRNARALTKLRSLEESVTADPEFAARIEPSLAEDVARLDDARSGRSRRGPRRGGRGGKAKPTLIENQYNFYGIQQMGRDIRGDRLVDVME